MKSTFKFIFLLFALVLVILPFATAFNEFLTRMVENFGLYLYIQKAVVPYMSRLLVGILKHLPGLKVGTYPFGVVINGVDVRITWNCLGWQSALLLFVSLFAGLRGAFSNLSRVKCILLGLTGTLLVNIFRMSFIAIGIYYVNALAAQIVHDYFAAFLTLIWLIFFWYFSYSFVLEPKVETKV